MANPPPSPSTSERTHKLKLYLQKLHLPHRRPSSTSTSSTSASASASTSGTHTPSPAKTSRPKGDDSILENRIKLKLTGDAKPGSHSACWGLTPDGQTHEPEYVDASEICGAVDFQDEPEKKKEAVKMAQ